MLHNVVNFRHRLHTPTIHVANHVDHKKKQCMLACCPVPIVRELWLTVAWAARALLLRVQF